VQPLNPAVPVNDPQAQSRHVAAVVAATVVENLPAAQSVQPEPAVAYLPAPQVVHPAELVAPDADPVPALQMMHE
jgi:hypothetical protein